MRFINVKEYDGGIAWINFDHVHVMFRDLSGETPKEDKVTVICVRGPAGWWKFLTTETPNSLRFRAEEGQLLDTSGDGFISKDLK